MKKMRGFAKVEFAANMPEIKTMLDALYSKRMIFVELQKQNKIAMSYCRLCELVRQYFPERISRKPNLKQPVANNKILGQEITPKKEGKESSAPAQSHKLNIIKPKDETFRIDHSADINDLV